MAKIMALSVIALWAFSITAWGRFDPDDNGLGNNIPQEQLPLLEDHPPAEEDSHIHQQNENLAQTSVSVATSSKSYHISPRTAIAMVFIASLLFRWFSLDLPPMTDQVDSDATEPKFDINKTSIWFKQNLNQLCEQYSNEQSGRCKLRDDLVLKTNLCTTEHANKCGVINRAYCSNPRFKYVSRSAKNDILEIWSRTIYYPENELELISNIDAFSRDVMNVPHDVFFTIFTQDKLRLITSWNNTKVWESTKSSFSNSINLWPSIASLLGDKVVLVTDLTNFVNTLLANWIVQDYSYVCNDMECSRNTQQMNLAQLREDQRIIFIEKMRQLYDLDIKKIRF